MKMTKRMLYQKAGDVEEMNIQVGPDEDEYRIENISQSSDGWTIRSNDIAVGVYETISAALADENNHLAGYKLKDLKIIEEV